MRVVQLHMVTIFLALFIAVGLQAQDFVRSRPPECRCQFEMPGIPVSTSQRLDTDVGEIIYHSYVLEGTSSDQNYSCVVSFADYPQEAIALDSSSFLEDFFKSSIEQAASQLRGVVIYSTDITEGGHPGKLYRIDYGEGLSVKSKVFLVERRFYLVQAFYHRQKEVGHRVDKFVNSFQILLSR